MIYLDEIGKTWDSNLCHFCQLDHKESGKLCEWCRMKSQFAGPGHSPMFKCWCKSCCVVAANRKDDLCGECRRKVVQEIIERQEHPIPTSNIPGVGLGIKSVVEKELKDSVLRVNVSEPKGNIFTTSRSYYTSTVHTNSDVWNQDWSYIRPRCDWNSYIIQTE